MFGFGFGFGFKSYGGAPKSEGQILADAYKVRVEADGGVYENNDCVVSFLDNLVSI